MARNWLEEIVSELWRLRGYLVVTDLDLPMPKTPSRRVRAHSDIDVLAINDREVVHIECEGWWGPAREDEIRRLEHIKERFDVAAVDIPRRFPFLKSYFAQPSRTKRVFVTSGKPQISRGGPWARR